MSLSEPILVSGKNGLRGTAMPDPAPPTQSGEPQTLVQLENGQQLYVPNSFFTRQSDGSLLVPFGQDEIEQVRQRLQGQDLNQTISAGPLLIPVVQEELSVGKQRVVTGGVQVKKLVREHEQVINEPTIREEVQVERVPVNLWATDNTPPQVRYEGETMIVPLIEEVLVVEKRLLVKEELRITKRQIAEQHPQTYTLRSEEVQVERVPAPQQWTPDNNQNYA